jgi:hypothetical protein
MQSHALHPDSMDLAMHLMQGDRQRAAGCMMVHSNLRVFALPECVALQQMEAADRMYSACSSRLRAVQRMSFCSICAINGKGFGCKLRVCCITGKVSCITCPPGTVVTIDMVGTLLKIGSIYYYLCPCCIALKVWAANGMDLCPWLLSGSSSSSSSRCCNCVNHHHQGVSPPPHQQQQQHHPTSRRNAAAAAAAAHRANFPLSTAAEAAAAAVAHQQQQMHCMVCHSRNVSPRTNKVLVDSTRRVLRRVGLCNRHAPPEHLMGMVTCMQDFECIVRDYCLAKSMARRAKRRMHNSHHHHISTAAAAAARMDGF